MHWKSSDMVPQRSVLALVPGAAAAASPTRPLQGRMTHAAGNQSGRIISNMFSGLISK